MDEKFTTGPWLANRDGDVFAGQDFICCSGRVYDRTEEDKANSNLLAAAPELYEALKAALEVHGDGEYSWVSGARAALSKALGES